MSGDTTAIIVGSVFGGILLIELIFYIIVHYFVLPNIQPLKEPPPHDDAHETFDRILNSLDKLETYEFETFFRGYFKFIPMEDIYEENFESFLAWVTYSKKLTDVDDVELAVVHSQKEKVYKRYNLTLKPGHNPGCEHCCMTYEDIPFIHRPLFVYVLAGLFDVVGGILYRSAGFRRLEYNGMEYWHHPGAIVTKQPYAPVPSAPAGAGANSNVPVAPDAPADTAAGDDEEVKTPMVLFHGITLGWMNYFTLVRALGADREVFLVDVDAIKMMSLVFEMPTPEKLCALVRQVLLRHKVERVHVVGHSFGSITAGWFVREFPNLITHLTLLDPVSLLLGLPDVAYSFLYRKPTTTMESIIYYVAASELTIAHVLRRHFWWYKNILWLEDLAPHIHIVVGLAGGDEVANATSVREYVLQVKKHRDGLREGSSNLDENFEEKVPAEDAAPDPELGQVEVVFWDGYSHGQCTACKVAMHEVHQTIKTIEKSSGSNKAQSVVS
jgi:pimeloyl-ACP methyl ester carboxylesterase